MQVRRKKLTETLTATKAIADYKLRGYIVLTVEQ